MFETEVENNLSTMDLEVRRMMATITRRLDTLEKNIMKKIGRVTLPDATVHHHTILVDWSRRSVSLQAPMPVQRRSSTTDRRNVTPDVTTRKTRGQEKDASFTATVRRPSAAIELPEVATDDRELPDARTRHETARSLIIDEPDSEQTTTDVAHAQSRPLAARVVGTSEDHLVRPRLYGPVAASERGRFTALAHGRVAALERDRTATLERDQTAALERDQTTALDHNRTAALERVQSVESVGVPVTAGARPTLPVVSSRWDPLRFQPPPDAAGDHDRFTFLARDQTAALKRSRAAYLERNRAAILERHRAAALERDRVTALERRRAAALERDRVAALERTQLDALEHDRLAMSIHPSSEDGPVLSLMVPD